MMLRRLILSAATLTAPLVIGAAAPLAAQYGQQNRRLFTWTGRVDREIQLAMRGRDVWTRSGDRDDQGRDRTRIASGLPRSAGSVRVDVRNGRGDVSVIQQPSRYNDYTTVIRIRDRSSGSDRYRIDAYWVSSYNDDRGGWDRRGDDDRGGWDRRGDDDRDDGDWRRGDTQAPSRVPRVEPRDRSNDGNGGWMGGRGTTALRWTGSVDNEVEIRLQGRRADYRTLSGSPTYDARSEVVGNGLPQWDMELIVNRHQGRGDIVVVQTPAARNGYVAIVRVRDPQGGSGYYDFDISWR